MSCLYVRNNLVSFVDNATHCLDAVPQSVGHAGQPVILVVEDDRAILRFICKILRHETMAVVLEASEPYLALQTAREAGRSINLLISDVNLCSSQNGIDLAHELAAYDPAMKILLMSASGFEPRDLPRNWRFLPKPFSIAELLSMPFGEGNFRR